MKALFGWASRQSHLPLWLLATLVIVFILRIPSFFEPYWYGDEAIYLTVGDAIRNGLLLYRDIHDNKPPLIYLIAALAGNVFWLRVILAFWSIATIIFFFKLASLLWPKNNRLSLWATAIFALLTTLPLLEGNIANAEIFMIGPIILAFYLLLSAKIKPRDIFIAGIAFGVAGLFKLPAILDMGAIVLLWFFLLAKRTDQLAKNIALLVGGLALPFFLTFAYFWSNNTLDRYFAAAFLQNIGYLSSWRGTWTDLPTNNPLLLRAFLSFSLLLTLIVLHKKAKISTPLLFVGSWFVLATFAALLSERPYPHYLIQIVPSLSLLAGVSITLKTREQFAPYPLFAILAAALVFYKFYYYPSLSYYQNFLAWTLGYQEKKSYFSSFDQRTNRNYKIARFLSESALVEDKIFVWGDDPEIYALSSLLPATRYFVAYHIKDFNGYQETADTLYKNPPHYIITTSETRSFPQLEMLLGLKYVPLESEDSATIWLRLNNKNK